MPKLWKWNGKGMYGWELQVLMWVFIWAAGTHRWQVVPHIGRLTWFHDPHWKRAMRWPERIDLSFLFNKIPIGYEVETLGWCVQLRTDKKKWRHPRKFIGPVSWYKL